MVLKLDILGDLAKRRKTSHPNLLAMLLHSALTDHVNCLHQMSGQIVPLILGSCNLSALPSFGMTPKDGCPIYQKKDGCIVCAPILLLMSELYMHPSFFWCCTHPSFGMTMTQVIRDIFAWHSPDVGAICSISSIRYLMHLIFSLHAHIAISVIPIPIQL